MRCLVKMRFDVEAANRAIGEGTFPGVMRRVTELTSPEAVYFAAEDGVRTGYVFFDLEDASQLAVLAEPLFVDLKAKVTFIPVMNQEDLQKGLGQLGG